MKKWVLLFFVLPLLCGCEKNSNSIEEMEEVEEIDPRFLSDTLRLFPEAEFEVGFLSEQKYYTLNETIDVKAYAANHSDSAYSLYYYAYPPYAQFTIENAYGERVPFLGTRGLAEGTITIPSGDSLYEGGDWGQGSIQSDGYTGFKVRSGWYRLKGYYTGLRDTLFLSRYKFVRWIQITDEGEPLSILTKRYYPTTQDTLKLDVRIRNRSSQSIGYEYADRAAIESVFVDSDEDTLWQNSQTLSSPHLRLDGHVDSTIYAFRQLISDSPFADLFGRYKFETKILFKTREPLISTAFVYFYPDSSEND